MPCLDYMFLQADIYLSCFLDFCIARVNTLSVHATAACQAPSIVIN